MKTCTINGHRHDISWYYWNFYNPDYKIVYKDGNVIHHINENHWDNSKENLIKMTKPEHTKLHMLNNKYGTTNKGKNHYMYGKKHTSEVRKKMSKSHRKENLSKEHRKNISESHRGLKNAAKKVNANFIVYSSMMEAAKALNVIPLTIANRIKSCKLGYSYIKDKFK